MKSSGMYTGGPSSETFSRLASSPVIAGSMGSGPASTGSIGISLAGLNGVPCSLGTSWSNVAATGNGRLRIIASASPTATMSCVVTKGD